MLDYLHGRVERIDDNVIVIAVNGLGIRVRVADPAAFYGKVGKEARIFTALDIQPRRWTVYGFGSPEERGEFQELWRIPGIGPGTALKLLPHVDRIRREGPAGIPDIPGIGQAKRTRLLKWLKAEDRATCEDAARELATALVALGLAPDTARTRAARIAEKNPGAPLEKLVRLAVRRR